MKFLLTSLLLLASVALPALLHADDFIQNGYFAQGTTGWGGKFDLVPANPAAPAGGGITVQLNPHAWTTLSQDIEVKSHRLHFTLVYSLSADALFSDEPSVLGVSGSEAGMKIWPRMDNRPGFASIYLEADAISESGSLPFKPQTGSTDKQSVRNPFGFRDTDNKRTLTIAFPPGKGTVTIYQATGTGSSTEPSPFGDSIAPMASTPAGGGVEMLENPTFADGTLHWDGNIKVASADDSTDLTANPTDAKGVTLDLRSSTWTTVKQSLRKVGAINSNAHLTIEYRVSSDFSLTDRSSDYQGDDSKSGIGSLLGFGSANIVGSPGQALVLIDEPPANRSGNGGGGMIVIYSDNVSGTRFTPGTSGSKTFSAMVTLPSNGVDDPVFCIAVPPGHGSITFTKISLTR